MVIDIDEDVMARITARTRKLMQERYGYAVQRWLHDNSRYVESMARFASQAAYEELKR